MKYCPICATECDDSEFFCHECGAKLDGEGYTDRTEAINYSNSQTLYHDPGYGSGSQQPYTGPGYSQNSQQIYGGPYGPSSQQPYAGPGYSQQPYTGSGYSQQPYPGSGYSQNSQQIYGPGSQQPYGGPVYGQNSQQIYIGPGNGIDPEGVTTGVTTPYNPAPARRTQKKPKSKLPVILGVLLFLFALGGIAIYMLSAGKVTVTYEKNISSAQNMPDKQKVKKGQKADEPSAPSADDYTFGGWFTDEALTQKYDFSEAVDEDLTLYAGFFQDVKVSFVSKDVEAQQMPSDVTVEYGGKVSAPSDPTAAGYVFAGWFANKKCTKNFDFDSKIKEDTVIYAGWKTYSISGKAQLAEGADPAMRLDELGGSLLDSNNYAIVDTNILGDGSFDFGDQPSGNYHIQLYYDGRVVADSGNFDYTQSDSSYIPGLYVPCGMITGKIMKEDGTPCAGASIQFSGSRVSGQTTVGSSGEYVIKYLPADTYTISCADAADTCTSILLTVETDSSVVKDQNLMAADAPKPTPTPVPVGSSYYISANDKIANVEAQSLSLEAQLESNSSDYSLIYSYFYLWDDVLNSIWNNEIQNARYGSMGESAYQSLLSNQLSWISDKGGENVDLRAAQMTKSRCYYLRDYVKDYY